MNIDQIISARNEMQRELEQAISRATLDFHNKTNGLTPCEIKVEMIEVTNLEERFRQYEVVNVTVNVQI